MKSHCSWLALAITAFCSGFCLCLKRSYTREPRLPAGGQPVTVPRASVPRTVEEYVDYRRLTFSPIGVTVPKECAHGTAPSAAGECIGTCRAGYTKSADGTQCLKGCPVGALDCGTFCVAAGASCWAAPGAGTQLCGDFLPPAAGPPPLALQPPPLALQGPPPVVSSSPPLAQALPPAAVLVPPSLIAGEWPWQASAAVTYSWPGWTVWIGRAAGMSADLLRPAQTAPQAAA